MDANLVNTIFTGLTLLATAGATFAAFASARSAAKAQKQAGDAEYRAAFKEAVLTATDCSICLSSIRLLVREWKSALVMSQVARGVRDDSSAQIQTQMAEAFGKDAEVLFSDVQQFVPGRAASLLTDEKAAHNALIMVAATLRQLRNIEVSLQSELAATNKIRAEAGRRREERQ